MWGACFSRIDVSDGQPTAMVKPFRRGLFKRVGLNVGEPVPAERVTPEGLQERVAGLMNV